MEATISHQLKSPHSKALEPDCLSPLASDYDTASWGEGSGEGRRKEGSMAETSERSGTRTEEKKEREEERNYAQRASSPLLRVSESRDESRSPERSRERKPEKAPPKETPPEAPKAEAPKQKRPNRKSPRKGQNLQHQKVNAISDFRFQI